MDRTEFANALIARRDEGEPFIDAANRLAPSLFAEKYADLKKLPASERQQCVMSVYGEVYDRGCTAHVHQVGEPSAWALPFKGVFVNNPAILDRCMLKAISMAHHGNRIALDVWAKSVVVDAIAHMPRAVGFPCDIALLQPQREPIIRQIMPASRPDPDFEMPIFPSELVFQPGDVVNF